MNTLINTTQFSHLFDTTVHLKYPQGPQKWHERVKLSQYCYHVKFISQVSKYYAQPTGWP